MNPDSSNFSCPTELAAEDVIDETIINDELEIDVTNVPDDSPISIEEENLEEEKKEEPPNPTNAIESSPTNTEEETNDCMNKETEDSKNFDEAPLINLTEHLTNFASRMTPETTSDHLSEEFSSNEETINDEYRYLQEAFEASEEYLINESSF